MVNRFDYNNDDVMKILDNATYTEEQKKDLFEKYKSDLKDLRRKEIINRLNECAKSNPIITQEEYINFLKKYNDDDLSKPFEVIESELNAFKTSMDNKYREYLIKKEEEEMAAATAAAEVTEPEEDIEITPDVTPFTSTQPAPVVEQPVVETPVAPEEDNLAPTVFEDSEVKEVMPEELPEASGQKGNASAIIISIIAIIIGIVIMFAIIKLK